MSLHHLLRVGRHWINPEYVIRVEDLSRPECPAGDDAMGLVMESGDTIPFRGDDAAELRRLVGDANAGPRPSDRPEPRPGETLSGRAPAAAFPAVGRAVVPE